MFIRQLHTQGTVQGKPRKGDYFSHSVRNRLVVTETASRCTMLFIGTNEGPACRGKRMYTNTVRMVRVENEFIHNIIME